DLVLISPRSQFLVNMVPFTRRRVFQAEQFKTVESVSWVYARVAEWCNIETRQSRSLMIFAFDPVRAAFDFPVTQNNSDLKRDGTVFCGAPSRPVYGPLSSPLRHGRPIDAEPNNRRVTVAGLFNLGISFGIDGSAITSDLNFLRMFPNDDPGMIEIGLIR